MDKKNLIDLFKAGGESTALAFEMNRHSKLISRYEIEKLTKKLVKDKKIHSSLLYNIAKKYKIFPMYKRMYFRDRCKGYFYETTNERKDKINAVLYAEISRELHIHELRTRFLGHTESLYTDSDFEHYVQKKKAIYLMHVRISQISSFNLGLIDDYQPLIENYDFENPYSTFQINTSHLDYIALRKEYGYANEPISPIFL